MSAERNNINIVEGQVISQNGDIPAVCLEKDSPFKFVSHEGSITIMHYEGHAESVPSEVSELSTYFMAVMAIFKS